MTCLSVLDLLVIKPIIHDGFYSLPQFSSFQDATTSTTTSTTTTTTTTTSTTTTTTTTTSTVHQCKSHLMTRKEIDSSLLVCSFIQMTIIPGISNISHPIQIRLEEDFYLSSSIQIICNASYRLAYQWSIYNCSSTFCSTSMIINLNLIKTSNEFFLPARTLSLGFYQIELMVTMNLTSLSISQSRSIYLLISPAGTIANLVPLGTSMITNGIRQDLHFNPGEYSIDLDDNHFNASVRNKPFLFSLSLFLRL